MEFILNNLRYILPPVIGFFIGLVTNGLAIFMLFHPYEEKRMLGVRVPFTPGAIPREHKRLAHKIAETICGHLLTNEEILQGFEKEGVKEHILATISGSVDSLLDKEILSVFSLAPKEWEDDFGELIDNIIKKATDEINNIIDSDDSVELVRHFVGQEMNRLLEFRFSTLLNKEHISKLEGVIKGVVTRIYHSIGFKDKAYAIINAQLDDFIFSSKRIDEILSGDMLDVIRKNVIGQTQELTKSLFIRMKKEQALKKVEQELKRKIKEHVRNIRFLPRLITDMPIANYKFEEFLDNFFTDARGEDELNAIDMIVVEKMKVIMGDKLDVIFSKEIKEVMLEIPSDTISQIKLETEKKLYEIFTDKDLEDLLISELDEGLIDFEEMELQKLLPELTEHDLTKIKDFLTDAIIAGMRKKGSKDKLASKLTEVMKGYCNKDIGSLSHLFSHSFVEKIKTALYEKSFVMITQQTPALLEQLDIRALVEKKVEEFPLDELESIVIQIAGAQLKQITLLGGVLGFIIGLLQVIINMT